MFKKEDVPNALETLANVVTTFGAICEDSDTPPKLNRLFKNFCDELYLQAAVLRNEYDIMTAKQNKPSAMVTT